MFDGLIRYFINPNNFIKKIEDYNRSYILSAVQIIAVIFMSLDIVFNTMFYQDWKIRLVPIITFLILSISNLTLSKLKCSYQVCSTFFVFSAYSCFVLTLTITSFEHFNSGVFYFFPLVTVSYLFIDGLKRNLMFIVFILSFFLYVFRQFIFPGLPTGI